MLHVTPFRQGDLLAMKVQARQAMPGSTLFRLGGQFEAAGRAFTGRDDTGRVLFCGGAVELHEDHAQLWGIFAEAKGHAMFRLLTATRTFIASLPHRRVDTPVHDDACALQWARLLGLRADVRLRDAAPGGGDLILYRRVD
jgi:hypothetical protein